AGFLAFVPLYSAHIGLTQTSAVFLVASGTVVVVRLVGATIPDRFGPRRVAGTSFLAVASGFVTMALWSTTTGLFVGTAVMAVGLSLVVPSLVLHATRDVSDDAQTRQMSVFTAFLDLASALGPVILGLVVAYTSFGGAFLFSAAAATVALVAVHWWVPHPPTPGL